MAINMVLLVSIERSEKMHITSENGIEKKMQRVKNYGQIKISTDIMAISFVVWADFSTGLGDPLECSDLSQIVFGIYPFIIQWDKFVTAIIRVTF